MGSSFFEAPASRDGAELAIGYGLMVATCWTERPVQTWLFWLSALWIILATVGRLIGLDRGSILYGKPVLRKAGLHPLDSLRLLWVLAAAAALGGIFLWVSAELNILHPIYGSQSLRHHAWGYVIWAIVQEFILLDFVLARLLRLAASQRRAILVTVVLFAGVHVPNPLLAPLTLLWGWIACRLFLRYRGLFTLGLTHGLLGLVIAVGVPNSVHHHMRVGLGYLQYHAQTSTQSERSPGLDFETRVVFPSHGYRRKRDQSVSTVAWVIADAATRRLERQALP